MSIHIQFHSHLTDPFHLVVLPVSDPAKLPTEWDIPAIRSGFNAPDMTSHYSSQTHVLTRSDQTRHTVIKTVKCPANAAIDWRFLGGIVGQTCQKTHPKSVAIDLRPDNLPQPITPRQIQDIIEGIHLGAFRMTAFKSNPTTLPDITVSLLGIDSPDTSVSEVGEEMAHTTNRAREWAMMPANILNPDTFAKLAFELFSGTDVRVSVIDQEEAIKLGMNALVGVGKGSVTPPRLLVLSYGITPDARPVTLVGKGVTFDTGGISIKPSSGMNQMKGDMSGAAAVLSAMKGVASLTPKLPILALIPLAENMPDGNAQRPGDVVTAMNGKTIEILNTDAEGRLILADALCYAVSQKADIIIDIATLTGACKVALGDQAMGLFTNTDALSTEIMAAAAITGERAWPLPLYDEYRKALDSDIADIAHCSEGRYGGSCTAAKFLEQFVSNTPWVHLDIASVMTDTASEGHRVKGMSGAGGRLLLQFLLNRATTD